MKGDSTKLFAILAITVVSVAVLSFILWPQVQKWEGVRFQGCTPCGDDAVKIEALNYWTTIVADQDVFGGVRLRLCNCRSDKVSLAGARINYKIELPGETVKCSGSYALPKNKDASGPLIPSLESQEGAKFDWYSTGGAVVGMVPESDKVFASRPACDPTASPNLEESASGKVTLELVNGDGVKESDYVWLISYSPICPAEATCRADLLGEGYCRVGETNIGRLNCESDERCCK